ncbi:MAG: addiction module protein [Spirochaetales bacterium]|nr:addiction module protein [Spirochaetales bacterium]
MSTVKKINDQAMTLSASERAGLAHDLILSLDDPLDFEPSPVHEVEIQRRLQMVREGTAAGRPADDVFTDIKAKYSKMPDSAVPLSGNLQVPEGLDLDRCFRPLQAKAKLLAGSETNSNNG